MPGPKFDLEWEFGARLEGMSTFSEGFLVTGSSKAQSLAIGSYEVVATLYEPFTARGLLRSRLRYINQCFRTARHAKETNRPIDVVLTYDPLLTGTIGWMLATRCRAKLICEVNGDYTNIANFMNVKSQLMRSLKRYSAGLLARFNLSRASGIRTLFSSQLSALGYMPGRDQIVMQIPEFVNAAAFKNLGEERTVLLVGFPFYVKGVDIAIAAFKRLAPSFPDWRMEIIGHYPDTSQLDAAIGDCAAISHHRPVLHREMNEYVGRCGIVLQCSRTEAMGRVLVEAMAAGKPRIATRVGGIPTVVMDGEDGILVESEDVDGVASALSRLMSSPDLRRRLGAAGARRIEREFSAERYFRDVGRLFAKVAATCAAKPAAER